MKKNTLSKRWHYKRVDTHAVLGLLLLGSLRYRGRGWTIHDLKETTSILLYVHRNFILKFLQFGREYLYPKPVKCPTTAEEIQAHFKEYETAEFHGTVGPMDALHITIEKCSHHLKQNHLGGKSKLTCHSYNLTCNHRRQRLDTTLDHPARWNHRTII